MLKAKIGALLALTALLVVPATVAMGQSKGGNASATPTVAGGKGPVTAEALIQRYLWLAGSEANAKSLVNGLRNGTTVTLVGTVTTIVKVEQRVPAPPPAPLGTFIIIFIDQPSTTTQSMSFTPPTGNMGWGNVDIALAFTETQLADLTITKPTPKQLCIALMGRSACSATSSDIQLPGVLQLRAAAAGGWGQVAKELGYSLQYVTGSIEP